MVANSGFLLTKVEYIKNNEEKKFVIVDSGMNDLIRPALYQSYHDIVPAIKKKQEKDVSETSGKGNVDIVGPICESSDFLGKNRHLEGVEVGDILVVKSCGAYGFVMSSNYNTRGRAAEIIVDGNTAKIVRKRETLDDLLYLESTFDKAPSSDL